MTVENSVPALQPLDRFEGTMAQRTYRSLRSAILDLTYRPGQPMRKSEICAMLGVSRSPVSEAIARLAAEGLVRVVPQAGTFVSLFSMTEIREGAFLREAIESSAAEFVAERIADEDLARLRRNLKLQETTVAEGDQQGFYGLDRDFHALILSATGYAKLQQVAETAWLHVDRARQQVAPIDGRIAETVGEHWAIYTALAARDPAEARSAMGHHLRQLLAYIEPLERERPELFDPD